MRPMHTDEAVHADKFRKAFLEHGGYKYDPHEYHGPTLNYFTLIPARLSSAHSYTRHHRSHAAHRAGRLRHPGCPADPAACREAWDLPPSWRRCWRPSRRRWSSTAGTTSRRCCWSAFTFGVIVCGYRYARTRTPAWAVAAGGFVGLMHATKETCIIAFGAMGLALALMVLGWHCQGPSRCGRSQAGIKPLHLVLGLAAAMVVSALFYSSFFQHPSRRAGFLPDLCDVLRPGGGREHHARTPVVLLPPDAPVREVLQRPDLDGGLDRPAGARRPGGRCDGPAPQPDRREARAIHRSLHGRDDRRVLCGSLQDAVVSAELSARHDSAGRRRAP